MSNSHTQAPNKSPLANYILQKMLLTNRADPFSVDTICIHIADVRHIVEDSTPVVYVDNAGQVVARVSGEQVEAVLGPHIDSIRGSAPAIATPEFNSLPADWVPSPETLKKIEEMGFVEAGQKDKLITEMRAWSESNGGKKRRIWDYVLLSFASRTLLAQTATAAESLQESLYFALHECETLREQLQEKSKALPADPVIDAVDAAMAALSKPSKARKQSTRKNTKARNE